MKEKVTIILIDDHEIARVGLSVLLEDISYIEVIDMVSNSKDLFQSLKKQEPDVIFMDIHLGDENGIDITRQVLAKYPDTLVIAFTSSDEVCHFSDMIDAGAVGFLLKNITGDEIKKALDEILKGNMYFSKEFLMLARQFTQKKTKKSSIKLSDREKEVLRHICMGFSNQEIADALSLSAHTVDAHRRNLLNKTQARNTASMIMIAFKDGLISYE